MAVSNNSQGFVVGKMPWTTVSPSNFPWEQEALDFVRLNLPTAANTHVWSNFEFVADNGSIYEVDMLCMGPWGAFLVEIKSRPGTISGNGNVWSWHHDGRSHTADNPLLLANRKCKALRSLLERQKAFSRGKGERVPFIEALVFCSHTSNRLLLSDPQRVCLRSTIIAALTRREAPGLTPFNQPPVNTPALRAFLQAVDQSDIAQRPVQKARRAGDYVLEGLFHDSPTGSFQDWTGHHATSDSGEKLIRLYLEHRQSTQEQRQTIRRAAEREYQVLNRLDHPGILRAETLTPTDMGHALVFRFEKGSVRLDQFLAENAGQLSLNDRLDLVRQIAEAVAYAHRRRVVHRAISPQSVLVTRNAGTGRPCTQLYNFQVSLARFESQQTSDARVSRTLHAAQLLEDASTVYLAPEMVSGLEMEGEELDSFSMGAVAYLILSGQAPASNALELNERLASTGGALDLRAVVNGVPESLAELIKLSANAQRDLRYRADEFLKQLDLIEEELTAPVELQAVDPREAGVGDQLLHDLKVQRKLGTGSISTVLQVEDARDQVRVLKVASKPEHNARLCQEFEVLRRLRHPNIVAPFEYLAFGPIHGFTMERAGEETLAQRLRKDEKLEIDLLERFGEDLLHIVDYLDQQGIAHRDIKPDNLGVRSVAKGPLRLILFDFSLSNSPLDDIRLGTPPYLDPFLATRSVKRWDAHAERFSAAMTLYEMTTGTIPRWKEGSAPHLVSGEVTLDAELFPALLRDRMIAFFRKALRREFRERFDNAEQMRAAWRDVFRHVDQPAVRPVTTTTTTTTTTEPRPAATRAEILGPASLDTQLILLGLSTRLVNALERLDLVTVRDLLAYPLIKIRQMRGMGNKTRVELAGLVNDLRRRFPDQRPSERKQVEEISEVGPTTAGADASIDFLAKHVLGSAERIPASERSVLDAFLALDGAPQDPNVLAWPGQSDLGSQLGVSRAYVGQVVTKARERWLKMVSLTRLRETICDVLRAKAGVATHQELISDLLHLRGSALPDPERRRMASVVTRAAVEAERHLQQPRFQEFRRRGKSLVALRPELADFALALGKMADELVTEEPLPTSARVLERLQSEPFPEVSSIQGLATPDASRLVHLAAGASETACANARLELYPRGLDAVRALKLAQNGLFGFRELGVEELRERVASRFPEAQPLPDHPPLDALLEEIGLPLQWSAEARNGQGAYVARSGAASESERTHSLQRSRTIVSPLPRKELSEEVAEALRLEEKLRYAEKQGSFLVLAVPPRHLQRAEQELVSRFRIEPVDGDALFLDAMKAEAEKLGVQWEAVLMADSGADPRDWDRLQALVSRVLPTIRTRLHDSRSTLLLTLPGLFARYGQLDLFQEIRANVGTPRGPHGFWMVIPGHGPGSRPMLNGKAIPITNDAQFEVLNEAWIANQHRGTN